MQVSCAPRLDQGIAVCAVEDIRTGQTLRVVSGGEALCLYRLDDGVFATRDACTHGAASLADGYIDGGQIRCPLHDGAFDIRSGKAVRLPCTKDLVTYATRTAGGQVLVFMD